MTRNKTTQFFRQELPDFHVDKEMLAHLEQTFPNRLPSNPLENADQYAFLIGQQSIIKYIRALHEKKV